MQIGKYGFVIDAGNKGKKMYMYKFTTNIFEKIDGGK